MTTVVTPEPKLPAKLYGNVWLTGRTWKIRTVPHVAMRLRRMFERLDKADRSPVLSLTASAENTRELAWFLSRYPMDVDARSRPEMDRLVLEHKRRELAVHKIISGDYKPPAFDGLALPLRGYQAQASGMVLATRRLLLADEPGLGKTATSIGVGSDPRCQPALIVTLTDLPIQWKAEINRFCPKLNVHIVQTRTAYDLERGPYDRKLRAHGRAPFPDVIIISYSKLDGWADVLSPLVRFVCFDEIQMLRIPTSEKYKAAAQIADAADFRMGLSATPILNYGGEMFHVLNVLAPDALGTHAEFCREWSTEGASGAKVKVKDPDAFGTYLQDQGLVLRRTRKDVGRELPPLQRSIQYVECDTSALDAVADRAAELAKVILAQKGFTGFDKMRASEELSSALRQATGISKAGYVAGFVRLLIESGERVLLYGWHRAVWGIWAEMLKDLPWTIPGQDEPSVVQPVWWTGEETAKEKQEAKRRFIAGETPLLGMSLRAGAGVDGLQGVCRVVVFGELDWSPGVHLQCGDRVHRDGQQESTILYFLIAQHGCDPIMEDVLGLKTEQSVPIMQPGMDIVVSDAVDPDHMKRLAAGFLRQRGIPTPDT